MKRILLGVFGAAALLIALSMAFSFYSSVLVDYSLENLENALALSGKPTEAATPLIRNVYKRVLEDISIEEAAEARPDIRNLVLLDLASRSLAEGEMRAGQVRAKLYVTEIFRDRKARQGLALRLLADTVQSLHRFRELFYSLANYVRSKWFPELALEEAQNYSRVFLLTEADGRLQEGKWDEAARLYRRYLDTFPEHSERGFVFLSLAQVHLRQQNFNEARNVLDHVRKDYAGTEQAQIALSLLQKLDAVRSRESLVRQLKRLIPTEIDPSTQARLKLQLALTYISLYEFEKAEETLKKLAASEPVETQVKARFYLGWLYKLTSQFTEGETVLLELIDHPQLTGEFSLGLHAQLADIYYHKRDAAKALRQLEIVAEKSATALVERKAQRESWAALAELEKANIHYFDLKDPVAGSESLDRLAGLVSGPFDVGELQTEIDQATRMDLRVRAFEALLHGHVELAYDLFQKNLGLYPQDAWTLSGLATIYLLFAEWDTARRYAVKGYEAKTDEYTSSVLAFVSTHVRDYEKAILHYRESAGLNDAYVPAQFNLALVYLETKEYQKALELLSHLSESVGIGRGYLHSKILNNMGYAHWGLGERTVARDRFQEALAMTPDYALAQHNLQQLALGEKPEAAPALKG